LLHAPRLTSLQWGNVKKSGDLVTVVSPFCLSVQTAAISNPAPSAACLWGRLSPDGWEFYMGFLSSTDLKRLILEGALPRKTFSLKRAHPKSYHMEARRIA
jgi:hypothetical protein